MKTDKSDKREEQKREAWIKNVMRIYPDKSRKDTEELFQKIFKTSNQNEPKD